MPTELLIFGTKVYCFGWFACVGPSWLIIPARLLVEMLALVALSLIARGLYWLLSARS